MNPVLASWVTVLFHLPLICASWLVARRVLQSPPGLMAVRDAFLVGCILWRGVSLLLELSGHIDRVSVFVAHLLVLLGISVVLRGGPAPEVPLPESTNRWARRAGGAAFGVVLLGAAAALFRIAALPDPYDSLTYHLMFPAHWVAQHSFDLFGTPFGDIALTYTPAAVEGFFFGLMLPSGSDLLARVGQLPFFLVTLSLLHEMAGRGRAGAARTLAVAAPFVFACWGRLLIQASGSMVDIASATFFLAALFAIFRWKETDRRHELILAGALTGMFLGSRFTGVVFAPLLFVVIAPKLRWNCSGWLSFLLPLAMTGAFPYVRNLWLTGNPLYPISIAVAGWEVLPGLFTRSATLEMDAHVSFAEVIRIAWYQLGWIGPAWLALGVSAPFITKDATARWCAALAAGLLLLHCTAVPYNSNLRFLYPAWGMGIVAIVRAFSMTTPRRVSISVIVATVVYFLGWRLPQALTRFQDLEVASVAMWAALTLVVGALVGAWVAGLSQRKRWACAAVPAAVFVTLVGVLHEHRLGNQDTIQSRDRRYEGFVQSWRTLREIPQGNVAYCGLNLPYPLLGDDVGHSVVTIPLNGDEPGLLPHEAQLSVGASPSHSTAHVFLDRKIEDEVRWKKRVLEEFDYLAIYVGRLGKQQDPVEYDWVLKDGRHFKRIDKNRRIPDRNGLLIFQVVPD